MEGTAVLDPEIASRIHDALPTGLSPSAMLGHMRRWTNGATTEQLIRALVAVLSEQRETAAHREIETDYLLTEIARLGERERDLEDANEALVSERSILQRELEKLRAQLASPFVSASSGGQDHAARL
jgi:hypothetical protein